MNSWTRGRILGHGSTATVSLAASINSGDVFAVKSAELSQSEFLQREQRIHSSIESPYIVCYRGCEITKEDNKFIYNLFLDYMSGGTLTDFVHSHGGQLEESVIGFYTFQIVEALDYLHSNGIVHGDIKGRNILIGETGAKIADFGCAKRIDSAETAAIGGTPMFMAPEVARGEEQGFCSDVWALGCTIVEMATGGPPWSSKKNCNAVSTIYRIGFSDELPEFPDYFSDEAKDFLDKCLRRNPTERWTVKQLLNHSFLKKLKCENGQKEKSNSNSISYSPTSILEQGFWNSVVDDDESDMINGSSTSTSSSSSGGGSQRIRGLCLNESSSGGATNWEWDENWITVRCDEKKKNIEESNNSNMMMISSSDSNSNIRRRRSTCKYGKISFLVKDDDLLIPYYYISSF